MASDTNNSSFIWRGHSTFVVIAVGATLSLRDFLTFPVLAGENGGGAFLMLYILFLLILGFPLMLSEIMMGRMTGKSLLIGLPELCQRHQLSPHWKFIGLLILLAVFLILGSYSVVSGWSLAYFFKTGLGVFDHASVDGVNALFRDFQKDSESMMLWHTLFILAMVSISAQDLRQGFQKLFLIMVPLMALLLITGLIYAIYSGGMVHSVEYILMSDWSRVDHTMPLLALQRAFFTLTLGLGVMVVLGAYTDDKISIGYATFKVILIDLLFSIFTGLAINALIFSANLDPVVDDELAFRVLPTVFGGFDFGSIFGALFYLLLVLAAVTTAVALMESLMSYYVEKLQISRIKAAVQLGVIIWLIGLGTIFSYSSYSTSGFTLTLEFADDSYRLVNNAGFHDMTNYLSSHLIQPLMALVLALFVGWFLPRSVTHDAVMMPNRKLFELWNFALRFVVPALMMIVILTSTGLVSVNG